jgi:hypothetical protein
LVVTDLHFAIGSNQNKIVCHRPHCHIVHASDGALGDIESVARAGSEAILSAASFDCLRCLNLDAMKLPILLGHHIVARKVLEGG